MLSQLTPDTQRLFPAWAGVIPTPDFARRFERAFPRMGGGDPVEWLKSGEGDIFSPHGRG